MLKSLLTSALLLVVYCCLSAQYENYRFGRISVEEKALTAVPDDPDADAYVLFDRMEVSLMISATSGNFAMEQKVSRRLKLFRESSFDRANVVIGYYGSGNLREIKASVHLPGGGEIKLRNNDVNHVEVGDDYYECRFSFPQVTEGAIIEYTYVERDEEFNIDVLPSYYFQEYIPVRWAEYQVIVPEGFIYVDLANQADFDIQEDDRFSRNYGIGGQPILYELERYVIKDLPALEDEPYTNNINDHLPRIRKQLRFINMPGFAYDPEMSSWPELAEDILKTDLDRFTRSRASSRTVMDELEPLLSGTSTETQKAKVVYRAINNHQGWNEKYGIIPEKSPNKVWERGTGSAVENNTILLAVLKQLEIEAYPVMVGLRGLGNPIEYYPLRTQFQHMLVLAKLDGEYQVLDIAGNDLPFGYIRSHALNHRAWMVDKDQPQWISIEPSIAEQLVVAETTLQEDGMATVKVQSRSKGYYASYMRIDIADMEDELEDPTLESVLERYPEAELISRELPEDDDPDGPYSYKLELTAQLGQAVDDYLYVSPVLLDLVEQEVVDDVERTYPIDVAYGFRKRYISSIALPEGYEVVELPAPVSLRAEDNSMRLIYSISSAGQTISMNLDFQVNRSVFAAEEYGMFREMFKQVHDLQEAQLVLKKSE